MDETGRERGEAHPGFSWRKSGLLAQTLGGVSARGVSNVKIAESQRVCPDRIQTGASRSAGPPPGAAPLDFDRPDVPENVRRSSS